MNSLKKLLLPLSLIFITGIIAGFAIGEPGKKEKRQQFFKALLPVISEKRAELDKALTKKEKARISELKDELKAIRDEMKKVRQSAKSEPADGDREMRRTRLSDEQRSQMQSLNWERQRIMSEAFLIANAHKNEVMKLTSEIRHKARELYKAQKNNSGGDSGDRKYRKRGEKRDFRHFGRRSMMHGYFANPAHFILFDSERWPEKDGER